MNLMCKSIIRQYRYYLVYLLLFATVFVAHAQDGDLIGGVQVNDVPNAQGYVLFSPHRFTDASYLIDKDGQVVNTWESEYGSASGLYLLDNGHLLRAGRKGAERVIQEYDWDGNVVWEYMFDAPFVPHHDIQPMPNGNILVVAREEIPQDEAIELGFNLDIISEESLENLPDEIHLDSVFEINPQTDEIVWEWHSSDHLVQNTSSDFPNYGNIADFPQRVDLNYHDVPRAEDLTHVNSIAYNAASDLIIISVRSFSEIWVIDHNLTSEEARGSKGDLYYRWGNPEAYGQGTLDDRVLYFQHDARWVDDAQADSHLTLFNNGSPQYEQLQSHVIEFTLPTDLMTDNSFNSPDIIWQSTVDFFSRIISGAQHLPNGNVLITVGLSGRLIEVTPENEIVWDYINPIYYDRAAEEEEEELTNRVFRASFYPADFVGFADKSLQPQGEIEVGVRE